MRSYLISAPKQFRLQNELRQMSRNTRQTTKPLSVRFTADERKAVEELPVHDHQAPLVTGVPPVWVAALYPVAPDDEAIEFRGRDRRDVGLAPEGENFQQLEEIVLDLPKT